MGRFPLKTHFLFIFLMIIAFFDSFKKSFNSTAKTFIQRIYSFNSTAKYSFKEFIHSKNNLINHSMKILFFLKNAVSATPTPPIAEGKVKLSSTEILQGKKLCLQWLHHHHPFQFYLYFLKLCSVKLSKLYL